MYGEVDGNLELCEKTAELGAIDMETTIEAASVLGLEKTLLDCFGEESEEAIMDESDFHEQGKILDPGVGPILGPISNDNISLGLHNEASMTQISKTADFEMEREKENPDESGSGEFAQDLSLERDRVNPDELGSGELVPQAAELNLNDMKSNSQLSADPFDLRKIIWNNNPPATKKSEAQNTQV